MQGRSYQLQITADVMRSMLRGIVGVTLHISDWDLARQSAPKIGVSHHTIYNWLLGRARPSAMAFKYIRAIAKEARE